ncbi:MAG: protease PrsW [Acidimicrobiaceae bacterium]|nr:protease PrsW [Acidimicrobiaceae bacterium]
MAMKTEFPPPAERVSVALPEGTQAGSGWRWHRPGLTAFLIGTASWAVATTVTAATRDDILVPTVIVAGSFATPLAIVVAHLRRADDEVGTRPSPAVVLEAFLGAGIFGLMLAALLESYLMPTRTGTFIVVALIEETSKVLVIVLSARHLRSREPLDGMVLGAIVGAGFAAFESAGYAFNAYVTTGTRGPFVSMVQSEIDRALIAPFGHIIWSSIIGGVLFGAAAGRPRFRLTAAVLGTFVGVVLLHGSWDQADEWAIVLIRGFTGGGWHPWPDAVAWTTQPTSNRMELFTVLYDGLLLLIGLAGTLWFVRRWRRYSRTERMLRRRTFRSPRAAT